MKIARDRVFIVDDNALVREALSCVLGEKGYLPVLLENAEELLSMNTPIHTIIIDIFMPGMGGIEGIIRVREQWPDVNIVAISGGWMGEGEEDALKAAQRVGANSILSKPFTNEVLLETLANLG